MKKLIRKIENKFASKKGETLTETLISALILTLISLAVAVSIQTALKITGGALGEAQAFQEEINSVIQGVSGEPGTISFIGAGGIWARHYITLYEKDGIIAFDPQD